MVSRTASVTVESTAVRLVPAVDRAARLLALLESTARPMTISELARGLNINKGTMRDLLETLRVHGLLERDEERKLYRLGPRLARLGVAALGQLDLAHAAHAYLIDLAHQIGGAVLLLVRDGDRATIVDKADAGQVAVQVSATVGRRIPLAAGACGKVFLSHVEPTQRSVYLSHLRPTVRTIRDPAVYAAELEVVRRAGYAMDDEEYLVGVRATSAPVYDARGRLAAAVLVVGLAGSLPAEGLEAMGEATAATARAISQALGAPPQD
jgi:IclR family transcriptional regulator, KDG regulon repressor